jgi:hypothetical protein
MRNKGIKIELTRLLGLVVAIGLVVLPSAPVGATPPISGPTIEFEGAATNVGSHTDWVKSVAVGDLDGDGDLDVVSGGHDSQVCAWRNDGTPFSDGTWTQQEVGSHTWWVQSVAVGDLDGDGDLGIVSGGFDNNVNAWQNQGGSAGLVAQLRRHRPGHGGAGAQERNLDYPHILAEHEQRKRQAGKGKRWVLLPGVCPGVAAILDRGGRP